MELFPQTSTMKTLLALSIIFSSSYGFDVQQTLMVIPECKKISKATEDDLMYARNNIYPNEQRMIKYYDCIFQRMDWTDSKGGIKCPLDTPGFDDFNFKYAGEVCCKCCNEGGLETTYFDYAKCFNKYRMKAALGQI